MTDRVSELKLFFSTPVWVSRVKNYQEVNKKILEYIKSLESQNPKGVQKSNSKGWHSQDFDMNADNIKLKVQANNYPSWQLTNRQICDLELILNGGFDPLNGFLSKHKKNISLFLQKL